jgi:hypothetical protein
VAFITSSFAMPSLQLPSRERLAQALARVVTIAFWAMAIAYTAGRLARIGCEWARPRAAKVLLALGVALDGGLAFYPDQPEPDPTPGLDPELEAFKALLNEAVPLTQARLERLQSLTNGVPVGEVFRMPAGESLKPSSWKLVTVYDRTTGQRADMSGPSTEPA